jgi:hypothetical protein
VLLAAAAMCGFDGVRSSASAAGGYRQEATRKFFAQAEATTEFLRGVDLDSQETMRTCLAGKVETTTSAGQSAVSSFDFVQTAEEIFDKKDISVEARASIRYLGASAKLDVRHEMTRESMKKMENGAVHGYYEKVNGVRWLTTKRFTLTPWAQELHDRAVKRSNMELFYAQCGHAAIVGKQYGSFLKAIGVLSFSEQMSKQDKRTAVEAALKYSGLFAGGEVAAGVEKGSRQERLFKETKVHIQATWSGNPRVENPTNLIELADLYRSYTTRRKTDELLSIRVAPYEELVDGFGELGGTPGIGEGQRRKVQTIMNGLAVLEYAAADLRLRDHRRADVAEAQVGRELEEATRTFRRNGACLRKGWSPECGNLEAKFATFPKARRSSARELVGTLLEKGKTCGKESWALVNRDGFVSCRSCALGEQPVFLESRDGRCGFLDGPRAARSVRLRMDDLARPLLSVRRDGVKTASGEHRPDVCATRGRSCLRERADAICVERGFEKSTDHGVMRFSPTFYADEGRCDQEAENRRPVPESCRTFRYIDCECPADTRPRQKEEACERS